MSRLPAPWNARNEEAAEAKLRRLHYRFRRISRRYEWSTRRRRLLRRWWIPGLVVISALTVVTVTFARSPWPLLVTAQHILAAPNCAAARAVGLAPAYRGQPGYYARHDADNDGIACKPWRGRR